jgi:16S rRNA (cytosine967-C5)-methyltransferase
VIGEGAELQGALLDRASAWVKPGGTLVYSVCSLEPQEGEEVIRAFLQRHPGYTIGSPSGAPSFVPISTEGWVRILPGPLEDQGGLDGFFMVRLVRAG